MAMKWIDGMMYIVSVVKSNVRWIYRQFTRPFFERNIFFLISAGSPWWSRGKKINVLLFSQQRTRAHLTSVSRVNFFILFYFILSIYSFIYLFIFCSYSFAFCQPVTRTFRYIHHRRVSMRNELGLCGITFDFSYLFFVLS